MKELLRIEYGSLNHSLSGYCLSVYESDVIYIQSFSDKSLHGLLDVLLGRRALDSGKIYFREREICGFDGNLAREYGIYAVTFGMEFVENMSIAENLKPVRPSFQLYSARKNRRQIQAYLEQEGIELDAQTPVWRLTEGERKKLGVLRAKLFGSCLVILDMTSTQLEDRIAEEICGMVREMRQEGMTFLILSSRYTPVAEAANRMQYISRGYDRKEWRNLSGNVRETMAPLNLLKPGDGSAVARREATGGGLYVYDREMTGEVWDYLLRLKEKRPDIWDRYIRAEIPPRGEPYTGSTAVIPGESGELLFPSLSIDENLTIAAGKRIADGKYGVIRRRLQKKLAADYRREQKLDDSARYISDLTRVQRKILSVARWELVRPEVMILERPCSDIDAEESVVFNAYLTRLARRGIRVVCLTESQDAPAADGFPVVRV